jgi:23S rRNA (adenine2503-C2)-methyltransferase
MKHNFKNFSKELLVEFIEGLGQKPYRAEQIINWIYKKLATSFEEMTDLPAGLRHMLNKTAYLGNLKLAQTRTSADGTRKFLFKLEDGESIESVLMTNTRGKNSFTLCISSQVGCSLGCRFCTTGMLGLKRNLKAWEIADQVISVRRELGPGNENNAPSISNIVFMGMGEPFNNINEVLEALRKLTELMGFSKRRITVSTAGMVPGLYTMAEKGPIVNLAVSLNATTDSVRNMIMPVNKKYPIKKLLEACRKFPLAPNRQITFEYIMLDSINDSEKDALRLINLLKGIRLKINIIPYNKSAHHDSQSKRINLSFECSELKTPSEKKILDFQKILLTAGITAKIRKSRGADILAACGQLKAAYEQADR